jgi:hypothetical protein
MYNYDVCVCIEIHVIDLSGELSLWIGRYLLDQWERKCTDKKEDNHRDCIGKQVWAGATEAVCTLSDKHSMLYRAGGNWSGRGYTGVYVLTFQEGGDTSNTNKPKDATEKKLEV